MKSILAVCGLCFAMVGCAKQSKVTTIDAALLVPLKVAGTQNFVVGSNQGSSVNGSYNLIVGDEAARGVVGGDCKVIVSPINRHTLALLHVQIERHPEGVQILSAIDAHCGRPLGTSQRVVAAAINKANKAK